jgi:N-acetylmuramic acid 6-phosphate (MurNAc-6-P) etherase
MNEKGAVAMAAEFSLLPPRFKERMENVFGLLAARAQALEDAIKELEEVARDTQSLIA